MGALVALRAVAGAASVRAHTSYGTEVSSFRGETAQDAH